MRDDGSLESSTTRLAAGASARGIALLFLVAILLIAVGGVGLVAYAWGALNRQEAQQETSLAQKVMASELKRVAAETASANSWDEAYAHTREPIDKAWIDRHLGAYYGTAFDHDLSLVFDSKAQLVYVARKGKRGDPAREAQLRDVLRPLVLDAQNRELRRRRGIDPPGPPESGNVIWFSTFVRAGPDVYLVGVTTMAPNSGNATGEAPPTVAVSARVMNAAYLGNLERELGLRRPFVGDKDGPRFGSTPLLGVDGQPVATLRWKVTKPAVEVMKRGGLWIGLVVVLLAVTLAVLGRRLRDLFRRLDAKDAALRESMSELTAARDQARASSIAKSSFIANISHEVRTPLNGVLGMAQALARDDLEPAQQQRVATILRSGEGLLTVLNDVLDISKIEAGRLEISRTDFDLGELIDSVCASYVDVAALKATRLYCRVTPEAEGRWMGDPARIRQILLNLVSNALKFTDDGEVRVVAVRDGERIAIRVEDQGIGVPAAKLAELFEKFTQVDASSTRRYGGAGLGLAISRDLARLMGGDILVESQEGVGSTFSLVLPLVAATPADLDTQPVACPAEAPTRPLRILAAEDNNTNQLVLRALLQPLGGELDIVTDGAAAVESFNNAIYDVVLMDIQMPGMNGVDATRMIRQKEIRAGLARTPILALTANTMAHHLDEYAAAGMDGHIAKPVQVAALYEAMFTAVEAAQRD